MTDISKLEQIPNIAMRETKSLRANPDNAKDHGDKQVRQIAARIERFGFLSPIVIDENSRIAAGHGRWAAAKLLDLKMVPVIHKKFVSEEDFIAYGLTDNKLVELRRITLDD